MRAKISKSLPSLSLLLAAFFSQAVLAHQVRADAISDWLAPMAVASTNPNDPSVTYSNYSMNGQGDCSRVSFMKVNQSVSVSIGNYSFAGVDQYHCSISQDALQLSCKITSEQGVVSQGGSTDYLTITKNQDQTLSSILWEQGGHFLKKTMADCSL